ncbi:holo-[acyl-carrier protein] synthase [Nocardioides scoriae]|uniref:Holo-[acyl-carrier-protein] synthase n=1 Tax=Nocardioides scoriae TaxID=642780 RepID=A0A1H1T175_9ACTN|nr:holo-ACP synthase [Nocardioides scoriae]SDS53980.1 holo-[acyl-carrier protein] synthase [Nocardioides scoriae]
MIVGIGTDVVDLARFAATLERTPTVRARLFTPAEAALRPESLAARFAAKEALAKALGAPGGPDGPDGPDGMAWHDAEVVTDAAGAPRFELRGTVAALAAERGATTVHLSLSHDAGVALAFVVLES